MFKKLLILAAVLSLASCSSVFKKNAVNTTENDNFAIEDSSTEVYQPVENEDQAEKLNQQAAEEEQEVEVQDRVFFDYDSAELSDESKKVLDTQILWLKSDTAINITIEGHCDERGTREYNIALGDKRASAAKNYLVANGIDTARIKTISYGKEHPIYFGSDEAVISKNRRAVTVTNQ
jgi:peptidoglycan-associated lipoprotein